MTTTPTKSLALLAAALLSALPAFAQVKTEPKPARPAAPAALPGAPTPPPAPKPPVAVAVPGLPPTPAFPAQRKLSVLQIPLSELAVAVDLLQRTLEDNGLEQLNILFGPDIRELDVSSVTLRNVTGPDALQLIAAAAGCTVDPMYSAEAQILPGFSVPVGGRPLVIGYQLRGKPKPPTLVRTTPGAGGPPPMSMPGGMGGGPPRIASTTSPAGRITRIYPLGVVTPGTDFLDLETTLRDIFKADGVAVNDVSLALHEKTNVLVVNAAEPVHALVEQFLTALNTNTSQADRQNTARDRAMGREELESAVRAQKRLAEELAERDAQMRELQKELRKLQDAVQKPPSAK